MEVRKALHGFVVMTAVLYGVFLLREFCMRQSLPYPQKLNAYMPQGPVPQPLPPDESINALCPMGTHAFLGLQYLPYCMANLYKKSPDGGWIRTRSAKLHPMGGELGKPTYMEQAHCFAIPDSYYDQLLLLSENLEPLGAIAVGDFPIAAIPSANGRDVYVLNAYGASLMEVSLETRQVVRSMPVPRFSSEMLYSGKRHRLYVAVSGKDEILEIDPDAFQITRHLTSVRGPRKMALSADERYLYVAHEKGMDITTIDLMSLTQISRLSVPATVTGMAMTQNGLWLSLGWASRVVHMALPSGEITDSRKTQSLPSDLLLLDSSLLVVCAYNGNLDAIPLQKSSYIVK